MKKIISTIMVAALLYNGAAFAENIVTKYDYDSSYKVTAIKDIKKPDGADFVYIVKYDVSGRMTGFTKWNGTAVSVTDAASTKVIAVKGNKITPVGKNDVITSDTKVNTYTVTVNADSNGTCTPSKAIAAEGEKIELTVAPNEGFEVDAVKLGDTVLTAADGKYTFTMPANNVTVTVSFKAVVTQETAVEKATKALKAAGLKDSDINVVKWSDFKAIGEPEEKTYAVNVTNLTPGCGRLDIEPAVYGAVKAGTEIKLTPIANDGYELDKITVDNNKLEAVDGKYSFTMPAKDVEVTVSFKAKVVEKTAVEKAVEALKAVGVTESDIPVVTLSDFKELGAPAAETYKVTVNEVEHCTVTVTPEEHSALINGTSVKVKVTPENGYEAKIMVNGVEQTVDSNGEFTFAIMGADVNIVITVVKTVSAQENAIAALKSANVDETNIGKAAWSDFNEIN